MFQATGWRLEDTTTDGTLAKVFSKPEDGLSNSLLRRFEFNSKLQRMSVICKREQAGEACLAFVKGSPEMLSQLCRKNTLPQDFKDVLTTYTQEGYRVIALAYKELPNSTEITREEVEFDLTFLGLLIMENKLKEPTKGVIETLKRAEVEPIMATGDNVLTAISVAGKCGIIDNTEPVYFGDVEESHVDGDTYINWQIQGQDIEIENHLQSVR